MLLFPANFFLVLLADRKSTRLNSSHLVISYAVFCLKKKKMSLIIKTVFRIRMIVNFGIQLLTITNLSTECLILLTKLVYDARPITQLLTTYEHREIV